MNKSIIVLAIWAFVAAFAQATIIIDKIGASCGGLGAQAPPELAADNCWKGYMCDASKSLICVRNSQWYWACETKGSIGPDGKPINESQCKPNPSQPNGRKLISETTDIVEQGTPTHLVVPEFGSCGGTGTQVPKDRKPVDGCWENTSCQTGSICIKEDAYGYYYQCLKPGSMDYTGKQVFVDACAKH